MLCKCGCERELTQGEIKAGRRWKQGHHKAWILQERKLIPCACGCGGLIYNIAEDGGLRQFIHGHWAKSKAGLANMTRVGKSGQGKSKSVIHRKRIGEGNARRIWTDKSRAKVSASITELWANPEYYKTQVRKVIQNFQLRPTSIEKQVMALIEELQLPFRYVGDGTCFIARANPDFIGIDSKMIIEVAGDYWHNESYEQERTEYFAKHGGFKTLVIWQHELDCPEAVKQRLLGFVGEGK